MGVALPFVLDSIDRLISRYVTLPPSNERWSVFVAFGILFAVVGFLQRAYVKGDFPWLFGKIGGGVVSLAFYSYIFLFLPSPGGLASSQNFQLGGLLALIYLSIGLSYLHLILDFVYARRTREARLAQT